MNQIAIRLQNVSKKYILHHEKPTLTENIFSRGRTEQFWALKDVNLTMNKGDKIGIIGRNGSGKTTLLEIIAGITTPTTGSVTVKGRLVSLIELEAGFHPDLTGEENIFLNGLLAGMTRDEIRNKLKDIISFAGLGEFIDSPFYTYSEGMKLRLGFSILTHTDPDIVLLDENLSVGDQEFREKSYNKIRNFFEKGKTVILVSHYMELIKMMCSQVIWLDKGRVKLQGKSRKITENYMESLE